MVEQVPNYLYRRSDPSDTETPRECHLQAMLCAYRGTAIPYEVYQAVLLSAERNQENLKRIMDSINTLSDLGKGKETSRSGMMVLAQSLINSEGIKGPKARRRRLANLDTHFQKLLISEETGPTE